MVHFLEIAKRIARQLLAIGENRFELLLVELEQERGRLLRAILLALGVAAFGMLAGVGLTAAIVVLFWKLSPVVALLALTFLYGMASFFLYWRLRRLLRHSILPTTVHQLRKDRLCLEKHLTPPLSCENSF